MFVVKHLGKTIMWGYFHQYVAIQKRWSWWFD